MSQPYQRATTLVHLLTWMAESQPDRHAYGFLKDGVNEVQNLTNSELHNRARVIGAALQDRCNSGDRILLVFPPGLDFVSAFFGCLYAGVIAIPAPSPDRLFPRLRAIAEDSQASLVLTTVPLFESWRNGTHSSWEGLTIPWVSLEELEFSQPSSCYKELEIQGEILAYLQYTSGSTASPKGVMITHNNVISQCADFGLAGNYDSECVSVNWMPHFHDFGLVKGILLPLYVGISAYIMSPLTFLKRPINWLEAMSHFGGTHSGGPNFAYEHCVRKTSEVQRSSLNLQRWRMASCGAEPVRKETIENFIDTFRPYGFQPEAFHPGYGLAEFTLMVSIKHHTELPHWEELDGKALESGEILYISKNGSFSSQTIVGCGKVGPSTRVVIVNPHTLMRCEPLQVGEIWLAGPNVAQGYWHRPKDTQETFDARLADTGEGPFLRTGDLGFIKDGELFVTGRIKDLIIIRGRNYYPQDIEQTVERSYEASRLGKGVAFSSEVEGEERLIVVQEVTGTLGDFEVEEIAGLIRQKVMDHHDIQAYAVVFVKTGSIPKTSSGKIQRHSCRSSYLTGELAVTGSSILNLSSEQGIEQDCEYDYDAMQKNLPLEERQIFLESYLCKKVSKILNVDTHHIHPTYSMNSLGLDSLMVVEIRNQIEFDLGIEIPVSAIFEASSLANLANVIEHTFQCTSSIPKRPLATRPREGSIPLSFAQEGFWILNELNPENPLHTIRLQLQLTGSLNPKALGKAINQIVARHESLRTTFQVLDGQLVQVIAPIITITLPLIDLQTSVKTQQKAKLEAMIREEGQQFFVLEKGPLVRVTLVKLGSQEHVLLLSFHHIISDWRSVGVFLSELSIMYRGLTECCDQELPTLPIQYADYGIWQRQWLQGEDGNRLLSYWKKKLSGAPDMLDFPDRALRLMEPISHKRAGSFSLSLDQVRVLKDLGQQEGATLFMVLAAAFFVLLYRYTHQTDLIIGTPATNRVRQEVDGLIGVFINPLVLRVAMTGKPRFREILQRVRKVMLEAYDHQAFPFELLVKELKPVRDESRNPLFQVLFEVQSSLDNYLDLPGITSVLLPHDPPGTHFDLTVSLLEKTNGIEGVFEYNSDVFDSGFVPKMVEHFSVLLDSVMENPDQPIATLSILSPPEEHQLLEVWSGVEASKPQESYACIHELFESQVAQNPEADAVVHQDERLTYRELNNRANQLARFLQTLGVGPETLVGLCLQRGLELAVSILGILKAGGAYVPLDPDYPRDRMSFILNDTNMSVILTQSYINGDFFSHIDHVVLLDTDWEQIDHWENENLSNCTEPENLAYVLYTSGSTGMPKGVMGTHKGLVHAYNAWEEAYMLKTVCRNHFQMASVVFDVFTGDFVRALCSGGKLLICPEELALSPQLLDLMNRERIDIVEMVPATMRYVIRYLEERQEKLNQLKLWIVGADRWSMAEFYRLREFCGPDTRIVNSYGLTETTVDSTYCEHVEYQLEVHRPVPIGKPMRNTHVYILSEECVPVPPGVIGELYIGGPGVARGYLNRPELTKERFIQNPFRPQSGNRLYKTGDQARFLADGTIEFLGRQDHQVKINGFRIELGEVEHRLSQHSGVKENVVIAWKDKFENDILVAYVVVVEDTVTLTPQDLRKFLEDKLSHYMIPSIFLFLDHLPMTSSGKVDRRALPLPEDSRALEETVYQAPRTEMERHLVRIWENVLETTPVGVQDDFFDLGGYSLLAVSLFYQIEKLTGKTLPLSTFFHASTIEKLANVLNEDIARNPMKTLVPIQVSGTKPPLFIVHLIGGNVLSFAELSKLIGKDQPLYGLQSVGLDGRENPIDNIQEMASRYIEEIQLFQPRGPYFLAGGCMGGVVAFEMARQFKAKGHSVAFLGLVESWLADISEVPETWNIEPGPRMAYFIKAVKSQILILKNTAFKEWFAYGTKKLKVIAQMIRTLDVYKGNTATRNRGIVIFSNQKALSNYVPKPYSGKITYFLASGRSVPFKKDSRLKWDNYARGGFKVFRIRAPNAGQMFNKPYVELLGKKLKMALDEAQSKAMKKDSPDG